MGAEEIKTQDAAGTIAQVSFVPLVLRVIGAATGGAGIAQFSPPGADSGFVTLGGACLGGLAWLLAHLVTGYWKKMSADRRFRSALLTMIPFAVAAVVFLAGYAGLSRWLGGDFKGNPYIKGLEYSDTATKFLAVHPEMTDFDLMMEFPIQGATVEDRADVIWTKSSIAVATVLFWGTFLLMLFATMFCILAASYLIPAGAKAAQPATPPTG